MIRIRIESLQQVNRTAEIESKKSIKRPFESDLKQILALVRLDGMSLNCRHFHHALESFTLILIPF